MNGQTLKDMNFGVIKALRRDILIEYGNVGYARHTGFLCISVWRRDGIHHFVVAIPVFNPKNLGYNYSGNSASVCVLGHAGVGSAGYYDYLRKSWNDNAAVQAVKGSTILDFQPSTFDRDTVTVKVGQMFECWIHFPKVKTQKKFLKDRKIDNLDELVDDFQAGLVMGLVIAVADLMGDSNSGLYPTMQIQFENDPSLKPTRISVDKTGGEVSKKSKRTNDVHIRMPLTNSQPEYIEFDTVWKKLCEDGALTAMKDKKTKTSFNEQLLKNEVSLYQFGRSIADQFNEKSNENHPADSLGHARNRKRTGTRRDLSN
ncbi:hypothetical protein BC832DRAFT_559434 [Gaertneriomyces semiglobifer]|nr:hypothetical protein BC832DRAFT_559434 [Gaertneriomyces semiglobifer]